MLSSYSEQQRRLNDNPEYPNYTSEYVHALKHKAHVCKMGMSGRSVFTVYNEADNMRRVQATKLAFDVSSRQLWRVYVEISSKLADGSFCGLAYCS